MSSAKYTDEMRLIYAVKMSEDYYLKILNIENSLTDGVKYVLPW